MRKVTRAEIVDYQTYNDQREQVRRRVMEVKRPRRILVGDCLNFLFENTETIRYQVEEMMSAERIVRDSDIHHELDTYNDVLGHASELGCTLLIEIDDPETRARRLKEWLTLPEHLYIRTSEGDVVRASYDRTQIGEDRLSSVQYLKFKIPSGEPLAVGVDHPLLAAETLLSDEQRAALVEDLG